jgi:hypothetical protein
MRPPVLLMLCLALGAMPWTARGGGLPFDPSSLTAADLGATDLVKALTLLVGVAGDHRPQLGADPLNDVGAGVELGVQAAALTISPETQATMSKYGLPNSLPVMPMGKVTLEKGLSKSLDVGLSFIGYAGTFGAGGDVKLVIVHSTEGPSVALRACYGFVSIHQDVTVNTDTWTPEVVLSRRLDFAEPYIGLGEQLIKSSISRTFTVGPISQKFTFPGHATAFLAFVGVGFRVGPTGVKISMEGQYSGVGMHGLAAKVGFQF